MRGEHGVDNAQLERTLLAQHNVIARSQALACGMTDAMIRYRIRSGGPWQKLISGVYLTVTGAISAEHQEMAALLHVGPRSVITGSAAARRYGVRASGSAIVDVIVPIEVRCQSTGFVRVRRTTRMPAQVWSTGRIRFAGAARAAADAARAMTAFRDVRAVVSETVQKRLVARGVLVLHFTPQRIKTDPDGIIQEIRSALAAGERRPPLPIRAHPATA